MVKCITLEYPNGSVETRGGIGPWMLRRFNGDADAARQYILDNLIATQNPDAVARIEDVIFPANRVFRGAWKRSPGRIDVDMPKARIIKMDRVRVERNTRLSQADNDLKIAQDGNKGAEQARVRARRKALRDLPTTIQSDLDAITDPDELDAYAPTWPE